MGCGSETIEYSNERKKEELENQNSFEFKEEISKKESYIKLKKGEETKGDKGKKPKNELINIKIKI